MKTLARRARERGGRCQAMTGAMGAYKSLKINEKKKFLYISIFLNLGVLCIFKYLDFFVESLSIGLEKINIYAFNEVVFKLILPIGISFYTFQKLSYIFDLYNKKNDLQIVARRGYYDFLYCNMVDHR